MSRKRRIFDIDMPDDAVDAPSETFPSGKVVEEGKRRGPMASAISESVSSSRERSQLADQIRDENDALAHEHVRLKRLGLVIEQVRLDAIDADKLVRDRQSEDKDAMAELIASLREIGLSNPIRLERVENDRFQLIQGFRRLQAYKLLLDETNDADQYACIPAIVMPDGEALDTLYRKMVDENMVRKDISFAEMAQLALSARIRQDLDALGLQSSMNEIAVLRKYAGLTDLSPQTESDKARKPSVPSGAKSKTSFQFSRPEGKAKCVAGQGVLEVRVPRDFSMVNRRRLEEAINALLDSLKD